MNIPTGAGAIAGAGDNTAFGGGGLSISGTAEINGNSLTNANLSGAATGFVENGPTAGQAGSLSVGTDNTSTTYHGVIINGNANPLSLTKTGTGTLLLTGNNTYTGGTTIQNGVLQLGSATAIGAGALAVNGGSLDLAGYSVTVPSFSGAAGTVTSSSAAAMTLIVSQSNQPIATAFGGTISNGAGTLALDLTGGTLTLSGTDSYSGGTTVSGGELILAGNEALQDGSNLSVGNDLSALFGTVDAATAGQVSASPTAAVPEPGTLALLHRSRLRCGRLSALPTAEEAIASASRTEPISLAVADPRSGTPAFPSLDRVPACGWRQPVFVNKPSSSGRTPARRLPTSGSVRSTECRLCSIPKTIFRRFHAWRSRPRSNWPPSRAP